MQCSSLARVRPCGMHGTCSWLPRRRKAPTPAAVWSLGGPSRPQRAAAAPSSSGSSRGCCPSSVTTCPSRVSSGFSKRWMPTDLATSPLMRCHAHVHAMRLVPWLVWLRVPSSHVARPAHSYLGLGVPSPVPSRSYTRPVPPVQFVLMIRRLKPKTSLRNGPEACRAAFESLTNVCSQRSHLSQPRTAHALYMHCNCTCTVHALHTHCTCPVLALYMHAHRCARADPRACDGRCPLRAGRTLAGCY